MTLATSPIFVSMSGMPGGSSFWCRSSLLELSSQERLRPSPPTLLPRRGRLSRTAGRQGHWALSGLQDPPR
eukprot:12205542-Alexandrium_andersonii.AAC.1